MMASTIMNLKIIHLHEVISKLNPIKQYLCCNGLEMELNTQEDVHKICGDLSRALKLDLNLEEISSMYCVSVMLLLLGDPTVLSERLELLNECFNYSDMLKPTMIDYAVRELLDNFKFAATLQEKYEEYDYMIYLLTVIPHIIIASETGKMISLGLLRAFLIELSTPDQDPDSPIIMHIYRNISEIWQTIKMIKPETIMDEWSFHKIYAFVKSFGLILAAAALNTNNIALKQAGYRGFELPQAECGSEISEWFKKLKNKLEEKYKADRCKSGLRLARYIDFNILSCLSETANEVASETGNDAAPS